MSEDQPSDPGPVPDEIVDRVIAFLRGIESENG